MERCFEPPVIVATLLVGPALPLQGSEVGEPWRTMANVGDWPIRLMFAAEVVVMLAVVRDRRRWLAEHPLDVAVVILTPPVVAGLLTSLRLLRLLRLVRLLCLAKLARRAFSLAGVRCAALRAVLTAIAGGQAFRIGRECVGRQRRLLRSDDDDDRGRRRPQPGDETGKVVAVVVMLVGIAVVDVPTGAIAQRSSHPPSGASRRARPT
jgi:voltage-gated potassium channel